MKMFECNESYLPTEVDWRTMGAVSDVKDQVNFKMYSITIVNKTTYKSVHDECSSPTLALMSLEEHTKYTSCITEIIMFRPRYVYF